MSARTAVRPIRPASRYTADAMHIELQGLPRTAIPADVRRSIIRAGLKGVSDVAINYQHFSPTGRATLTLTHPTTLQPNLRALEKMRMTGHPITAYAISPPEVQPTRTRSRGVKGRAEAEARGLITGDGPHGGLTNTGKNIAVWGLPGRMPPEDLKAMLKSYDILDEDGQTEIFKIATPDGEFSLFSRHVIKLKSVSDAHRLVRQLHQTYYKPEKNGTKFPIRARVIY